MNHKIVVLVSGLGLALLVVAGFATRSVAGGAPTYDEVISSVDGAILTFDAADLPSESFYLKRLRDASKDLTDAKTAAGAGNKRGAKAELRNAISALRGVAQRLNSRTGRRKIKEPLRTQLADLIGRLNDRAKSIRRS